MKIQPNFGQQIKNERTSFRLREPTLGQRGWLAHEPRLLSGERPGLLLVAVDPVLPAEPIQLVQADLQLVREVIDLPRRGIDPQKNTSRNKVNESKKKMYRVFRSIKQVARRSSSRNNSCHTNTLVSLRTARWPAFACPLERARALSLHASRPLRGNTLSFSSFSSFSVAFLGVLPLSRHPSPSPCNPPGCTPH